jgi:arginine:ornithine antiporter/lysine permease
MRPNERGRDLIFAGIAVIYTLFLIFAGGLKFVLLACILYGPGTALYFWARREQGKELFRPFDWVILGAAVLGCVVGIYGLATGAIAI